MIMPATRGAAVYLGCFVCAIAALTEATRVLRDAPAGFEATRIFDGEGFVEAVTQFGREGGQVELQLDTAAPISMANATWSVEAQRQGFTGGTLLITAAPSDDKKPGVLDAAMKSGLTPFGAKYNGSWQGIIFINLCSNERVWDSVNGVVVHASSSMYIMPRPRREPRVDRKDSVVYIPYSEFSNVVYWVSLDITPFGDILQQRWSSQFLKFFDETRAQVEHMDEFSLTLRFSKVIGGTDTNVTYRATSNPDDPLGLKLPHLGGSLMPHRLCAPDGNSSGPLIEDERVLLSNPATWIVGSSAQLRDALKGISYHGFANNSAQKELEPIAMAIIVKDVSLADGGAPALSGIPLTGDVILQGPLHNSRPTLDFSGAQGVLSLGTQMNLFIRNLVLSGLASSAILRNGVRVQNSTSLNLLAIDRGGLPCHLHGVTLQVAKSDFQALLSAARRGVQWKTGASATLPLLEHISVFKPKAYNSSMIELDEYSGWGMEGKEVQFIPDSPLLESDILPDEVDKVNSEDSEEDSKALVVGIGVGVGGGLLLVALLAWLIVVRIRRNRREVSTSGTVDSSEVSSSAVSKERKTGIKHSKEGALEGKQSDEGSIALEFTDQTDSGSSDSHSHFPLKHETIPAPPSKQAKPTETPSSTLSNKSSKMLGQVVPLEAELDAQRVALVLAEQETQNSNPRKMSRENPRALVQKEIAGLVNLSSDDVLRLQNVIGKGAWGSVYKGTWKGLNVAVKTVLFTERTDGGAGELPQKARAILEAAVCTSMSHKNIVSTYHYDIKPVGHDDSAVQSGLQVEGMSGVVDDWKLYLVLEYCQCSLGVAMNMGLFHREDHLVLDTGLPLLIDVARGTQYLHDHFIIHGDLKPDNILLKTDPTAAVGFVAKISDFGLAIDMGPTATHVSDFSSGTPFYCAPEVVLNGRTSTASDAYSFGVVMAELCSKTPPWLRTRNGDFVANPSFPNFPPGLPRALVDLTLRCLDLDQHRRLKFDQIVDELQGILDSYRGSK